MKFATWFIHHIFNIVTRILPCASKDDESGVMMSRARFTRIVEVCVTSHIIPDSPNLQKSMGKCWCDRRQPHFFWVGSQVNSPRWIQLLPFPKIDAWNGFKWTKGAAVQVHFLSSITRCRHFGWLLVCWVRGAYHKYAVCGMPGILYIYSQNLHMCLWIGLADHRSLATTKTSGCFTGPKESKPLIDGRLALKKEMRPRCVGWVCT